MVPLGSFVVAVGAELEIFVDCGFQMHSEELEATVESRCHEMRRRLKMSHVLPQTTSRCLPDASTKMKCCQIEITLK